MGWINLSFAYPVAHKISNDFTTEVNGYVGIHVDDNWMEIKVGRSFIFTPKFLGRTVKRFEISQFKFCRTLSIDEAKKYISKNQYVHQEYIYSTRLDHYFNKIRNPEASYFLVIEWDGEGFIMAFRSTFATDFLCDVSAAYACEKIKDVVREYRRRIELSVQPGIDAPPDGASEG